MNEVVEPARRRSWLRRIAIAVAVSGGVLLALAILGIPLPMEFSKGAIESRATEALGREVRIGTLRLRVGFRPRLSVAKLRIAHPDPGRPDVLALETLDFEVGLPALLRRRIHVVSAEVAGVAVVLDPEARPAASRTSGEPEPEPTPAEESAPSMAGWSLDVQQLELRDLSLTQKLEGRTEPIRARLDVVQGELRWDDSVALKLRGSYEDIPFSAALEGASVADLLSDASAWPARLALAAAGAELEVETEITRLADGIRMDRIRGLAAGAPFEGQLALDGLSDRPRATGRIDVETVEVSLPQGDAFDSGAPTGSDASTDADSDGDGERPLQSSPVDLDARTQEATASGPGPLLAAVRALHGFETDLELTVAGIGGLGAPIQELAVALRVEEGELDFPVSVTVAEIPLSGRLRLEDRGSQAWFGFDLGAEASRVDALADALAPGAHVRGGFSALRLELSASGQDLAGHLAALSLKLSADDAELSYGAAANPASFAVSKLDLVMEERGPLRLTARGSLLREPVRLDLETGGIAALLSDAAWPVRLGLEGGGARVELRGESRRVAGGRRIGASLVVDGDRLAGLEPWLGELPLPDTSYQLRTNLTSTPAGFRLDIEEARLGESNLTGEVGRRFEGDAPIGVAALSIDRLDLSKLASAPAPDESGDESLADDSGLALDIPILPGGLQLADSDIDLRVGQLRVGDLELSELRFEGAIRDAHLPDSKLGLRLGEVPLEGSLRLDLRAAPHEADFVLAASDVDVGQLLEQLGIVEGVSLSAASLELEIDGEGATLRHILDQTAVSARVADARWIVRDEVSGEERALLVLAHATIARSGDGEGIALVAEGTLRGEPVALTLRTPPVPILKRTSDRHPVELTLETGGARLVVDSAVALPIDRARLDLALRLEGERLDRASVLLGYELPAIGPYLLASRMRLARDDYQLSDLELRIGESRLRGTGSLSTGGARPRLEVVLESEVVQLDDFEAAGGAPAGSEDDGGAEPQEASRDEAPREFLSADGLSSLDGRVELQFDRVLSGADELGAGRLVVSLEDGALRLDPLEVAVPGGQLDVSAELAYGAEGLDARFRGRIPRFDFGVLARRLNPETDTHGWLTLDFDVAGSAPELSGLMSSANGHLDFFVAPQNIETDLFDLWAVNVLSFIVPRLDSGPRSTLNCVVARFDLEDGVLRDQSLFLDTTRMVVEGHAKVDFREETIRAELRPTPKKAQMFTLQTNVELHGDFDDFGVRVPAEEFVTTFLRFFTSVVLTPVQRIVGRPLPADGQETCQAAWQKGETPAAAAEAARR